MSDDPDRPPAAALPLSLARRELCGDPRLVQTLTRLELQLAELMPGIGAGDWGAIRASVPTRHELIAVRDWIDERLIGRLRRGELGAWGDSEVTGWRCVRIPPAVWDRVAVLDWELGELGRDLPDGGIVHWYLGVMVAGPATVAAAAGMDAVIIMPGEDGAGLAPLPRADTIAAETRCRHWLADLMRDGSAPEGPKAIYQDRAHQRFGTGTQAFRRAWANAKADSGNPKWGKSGRPKKSKQQKIETPK